jgi:hypothetical protein
MTTLTRAQSLTRIRTIAGIVGVIGIIAAVIGLLADRTAFFQAYLVGFAFVALISLGCLFLLMINHVTGGHWSIPVQESLESGAQLIVVTALLFIPILFGLPVLYPWAQPNTVSADPLLQHLSPFLNPTFFVIRALIYFAVWIILAWRMTRPDTPKRTTAIIGLVLYFPLATLAAIDWFMSLEPHWYSTIYGVLFLASQALTAYAFVIGLLILTPSPAPEVSEQQLRQDLGNVLLTILITVSYLQFMQFLVIWSGDLPDEITWYLARTAGGWSLIALALIVFDIVVPFVLLLSRTIKRQIRSLALVALLILMGQFAYTYWLILPAFNGAAIDGLALVLPIGMSGLWIAAFVIRLRRAALES